MKLKYLIFIITFTATSFSQSGWFEIQTGVHPNYYIKKVFFVNSNTGYIVCRDPSLASSYLKRTTNGGNSWDSLELQPTSFAYVKDIWFIDNNTGFIVGSNELPPQNSGRIDMTTNGGVNWNTLLFQNATSFNEIYFPNNQVGWTIGYHYNGSSTLALVYKLTRNGVLTQQVRSYLNDRYFNCLYFLDSNNGFCLSSHLLYKTTNSGNNWSWIPYNENTYPNSTAFLSQTVGMTIGDNTPTGNIIKTNNGGLNWQTVFSSDTVQMYQIKMINNNIGFVVGSKRINGQYKGIIIKTLNGGNTWNTQKITDNGLQSVFFLDENLGYACGDNGKLWKTTDGGGPIGIQQISTEQPKYFSLSQNFPNPFNPKTIIKFDIIKKGNVNLTIFDILGKEIVNLVNQELQAGSYQVDWDATNYPSGIYFYKLETNSYFETKKMALSK